MPAPPKPRDGAPRFDVARGRSGEPGPSTGGRTGASEIQALRANAGRPAPPWCDPDREAVPRSTRPNQPCNASQPAGMSDTVSGNQPSAGMAAWPRARRRLASSTRGARPEPLRPCSSEPSHTIAKRSPADAVRRRFHHDQGNGRRERRTDRVAPGAEHVEARLDGERLTRGNRPVRGEDRLAAGGIGKTVEVHEGGPRFRERPNVAPVRRLRAAFPFIPARAGNTDVRAEGSWP